MRDRRSNHHPEQPPCGATNGGYFVCPFKACPFKALSLQGPETLCNPLCRPLCSPGLQSGGAGFQTRGNARSKNFAALALVAASQVIPTSAHWQFLPVYSYRNAAIGSIRMARAAGG